jgi:hypothetical protein
VLAGPGKIQSYTVVAKGGAPSEFEPLQDLDGDYAVVVVEFGQGVRVVGMVCESPLDGLRIGAAVQPAFRRLYAQDGEWRYGTKFRLVG